MSRTRNMLDYVRTELDTFDGRGFCTVDSLVLSWLAYTRLPADDPALAPALGWEGVRLADLYRAEYFATYYAGMWGEEPGLDLLAAVAASPRFRDVRVMGYVDATDPQAEKQFAAMTFRLTEDLSYVAFRGTDASLVGWKEDFNLAYRCPVPSQVEAAHYLADAAARVGGDLLVGGHSKGGNLAVYAAATAPRDASGRVTRIFSHDGPGFLAEFLATEDYRRVEGRVEKTLPQSSVVGMLLEQQEGYRVVRSNRAMIWQHDPFSWVVEGCDLVTLDGLTADARYLNRTVSAWLGSRTVEERERFIDTLYSVIDLGDVSTTHELRADWRRSIHVRARAFAGLDAETRSFVTQTLTALVSLGVRVVPDLLVEDLQRVRSGTSAAALGA
ncbi:DUF2974 domain-containing protein [uncultured Actinomyces sp.]|uniref:DUF2974 domain-containing protein n=1 Tax=uncultured Actinomyces sp. TaxID=249061 RepID=UPI002632ACA5|nr:DUF2974 domain-containing protein [uncultured Actinomyces sp.]